MWENMYDRFDDSPIFWVLLMIGFVIEWITSGWREKKHHQRVKQSLETTDKQKEEHT